MKLFKCLSSNKIKRNYTVYVFSMVSQYMDILYVEVIQKMWCYCVVTCRVDPTPLFVLQFHFVGFIIHSDEQTDVTCV